MLDWLVARFWRLPALVAGYFCSTAALVASFNLGLPAWLEIPLSVVVAPAAFAILVVTPVLRELGLTSGEWYVLPSLLGFVLVVAFYALIAWGVGWMATRFFGRR